MTYFCIAPYRSTLCINGRAYSDHQRFLYDDKLVLSSLVLSSLFHPTIRQELT
jgi:hypothetical protein